MPENKSHNRGGEIFQPFISRNERCSAMATSFPGRHSGSSPRSRPTTFQVVHGSGESYNEGKWRRLESEPARDRNSGESHGNA